MTAGYGTTRRDELHPLHGALFLLAGVSAIGFSRWAEDWADDLQRDGRPVPGEVVEIHLGEKGERDLDVRFRYAQEDREESVSLRRSSPDYRVGQDVMVVVDPDDPNRVTLRGEPNHPPLHNLFSWVGYFFGPFMVLIGSGVLVASVIRRRRQAGPPPPDIFGTAASARQGPWSAGQSPTTRSNEPR